jgi:hypothetical protein
VDAKIRCGCLDSSKQAAQEFSGSGWLQIKLRIKIFDRALELSNDLPHKTSSIKTTQKVFFMISLRNFRHTT